MIALYDYDPHHLSPNVDAEVSRPVTGTTEWPMCAQKGNILQGFFLRAVSEW